MGQRLSNYPIAPGETSGGNPLQDSLKWKEMQEMEVYKNIKMEDRPRRKRGTYEGGNRIVPEEYKWAEAVILRTEELERLFFPLFMQLRWGQDTETFYMGIIPNFITLALISTPYWPKKSSRPHPWYSNYRYIERVEGKIKCFDLVKLANWISNATNGNKVMLEEGFSQ